MRRDELVEKLRKTPFRPFRLYVSDGGTFDIRHPEMLMVTRHAAVVGMLETGDEGDPDQDYPVIDRYTDIDLLHVTRVEQLPEPERRPT
jgi:hypothetical protein